MKVCYPRLDLLSKLTEEDAGAYQRLLPDRPPVEVLHAVPNVGGYRPIFGAKAAVASGRLTRQKGFDRLVSAWTEVVKRHPDWRLRIFANGAKREAPQRQIDDLGLAGNASLEGFTSRWSEDFARAALFVLSSRREGFPMMLLEAMAAAKRGRRKTMIGAASSARSTRARTLRA